MGRSGGRRWGPEDTISAVQRDTGKSPCSLRSLQRTAAVCEARVFPTCSLSLNAAVRRVVKILK